MMKTMKNIMKPIAALAVASLVLVGYGCNKDDEENYNARFKMSMTDAPSDDANVQGVFVTVASASVDGKEVEGFEKQTIDIAAYSEGRTALVFNDNIEAGSYSNVALTFDYEQDADGNSPGCYVLSTDNEKHDLNSDGSLQSTITFNKSFEAKEDETSSMVIDLDLRKAVQRKDNGADDQYEFVAQSEFNSSMRAVEEDKCGTVKGEYSGSIESDESVVVYAYKKGTYSSSESEASSSSNLRYTRAESSSRVDAQGNYTIAFLEEGEYEIKAAKYRENADGEMEFDAELNLQLWLNGSLINSVDVAANSTTSINLSL